MNTIPTNIITGFLGTGKTTAIQYLLANKSENERWAILVNEFGEVGVDAALMNNVDDQPTVIMREVPGGCICCVAGLPMQVAMNQLLSKRDTDEGRIDRLIIEPTGLGHPNEIIKKIKSEQYSNILTLQQTLTLLDPRKLLDQRYTEHAIFRQQIQTADLVVLNKIDLIDPSEKDSLLETVDSFLSELKCNLTYVESEYGRLDFSWLQAKIKPVEIKPVTPFLGFSNFSPTKLKEQEFIKQEKVVEDSGYYSCGYIFEIEKVFDQTKLIALLKAFKVERLKAVFHTNEGFIAINWIRHGDHTIKVLDQALDSRIELIDVEIIDGDVLLEALNGCII